MDRAMGGPTIMRLKLSQQWIELKRNHGKTKKSEHD